MKLHTSNQKDVAPKMWDSTDVQIESTPPATRDQHVTCPHGENPSSEPEPSPSMLLPRSIITIIIQFSIFNLPHYRSIF